MKRRFEPAWYGLAVVLAAIVLFLRVPDILTARALSSGTSSVMGKIEDIQQTRGRTPLAVIRYSYEVDGKPFTGEVSMRRSKWSVEGMPVNVTYAQSNPAKSTVIPEEIQSIARNSLIICIVALLPLVVMLLMEVRHRLRPKS